MKRIPAIFSPAICLLFFLTIITACQSRKTQQANGKQAALSPYEMMIGSFNSADQAAGDSSYYSISLHMYPIWQNDGENNWLYVEQALNMQQDSPYRQRIYKVEKVRTGEYKSIVYKLKNEKNFIGKWQNPEYFNAFDQSLLEEREGCTVYLKANKSGGYEGSTIGKNCKSSLRGASYASSKVKIEEDKITSWDQGFDQNDQQVWGAMRGGYVFNRVK